MLALSLAALAATSASAQTLRDVAPTARLRVDPQRVLPPEPWPRLAAHDARQGTDPVLPLQPLLDRLPLQLIPELLRTEERIGFSFDKYRLKPHVGLHEVSIVITRPLSQ